MKRCVLLACCIALSASSVSAGIGAFCVYTDEAGTNCNFVDNGGLVQVYIIHQYADGVSASQFKLDVSATGWTHLGDSWNVPVVIGTSMEGVSVPYGACRVSPFVVGVVSFLGASAPANTGIGIVADPAVGEILAVDCDGYTRVGAGGSGWVNSSNACVCETNQVPELAVDPVSLDFGYIDTTRDFVITNRGGGTLAWDLSDSEEWLSLSVASGFDRQSITATIDRTGLALGDYSGMITVTSTAGSETVVATMTVVSLDPLLRVIPTALDFGEYEETLSLNIYNDGVGELSWNVSSDQPWLTATPVSGIDYGNVSVTVDRSGLAEGVTYHGNLYLTSNGGDQTVAVTVVGPYAGPILSFIPESFLFENDENQKILYIRNSNFYGVTLDWSITTEQPWLTASPSSGSNESGVVTNVAVSVFEEPRVYGTHTGYLNLTTNAGNATIPVTWEVQAPVLTVSRSSLSFPVGIDVRHFEITNTGGSALTWTITPNRQLISVDPVSGTNDQQVTVTVDRTGLPPGVYSLGILNISSNGGNAAVQLHISVAEPAPFLSVSPLFFHFAPFEFDKTLNVSNVGGGTLEWALTANQPWLTVEPATGVNNAAVTVSVNIQGMEPGMYADNLIAGSNGGAATIPVTLEVPGPQLQVSPATLLFDTMVDVLSLDVANAGGSILTWSIVSDQTWLGVDPSTGTNYGQHAVTVDRTNLATGVYYGSLFVTSSAGEATVPVFMWVEEGQGPVLLVSPSSLSFDATEQNKSLQISNNGDGILEWAVSTQAPWLSVSPTGGNYGGLVNVGVDRTGLAEGTHTSSVVVASNGGDRTVPVDVLVGTNPLPVVSPSSLIYTPDHTSDTFSITNTGTDTLTWTLGADQPWIQIVPPLSGTNDATVTVNVDPALVPPGPLHAGVILVSTNGGDTPVEIRFVRQTTVVAGTIAVYSDAEGTNCNFVDNGSVVPVYFFHNNTNGATGSQWRLDLGGLPWAHLGDTFTLPFVTGKTVTGISIGYGGCLTSSIYLGVANFFGTAAPACSQIRIVADPEAPSGEIEAVDCLTNQMFPLGGSGRVNPDGTCWCGPVQVRHTTWGAIKALYAPDED
jgi:hypothetical protein